MRDEAVSGDEVPYRLAILLAVMGSILIAFPGTMGALLLASMWVLSLAQEDVLQRVAVMGGLSVALLAIGAGYVLLIGYIRILRGHLSPTRQVRIWAGSALYNGIGFVVVLGSVLSMTLHTAEQFGIVALALCWLGFMTVLSVQSARLARERDLAN